jgi:hypothetical protein
MGRKRLLNIPLADLACIVQLIAGSSKSHSRNTAAAYAAANPPVQVQPSRSMFL